MKILELKAENFKRLKAVEITPDGTLQVIAGRNAQGKTSVLDAIWHALSGAAAKKSTSKPIRDGEDHAEITLDLGDLKVTRTFTADGKSTLKVESPEGARYPSPQKVLDELIGRLSFEPLAFAVAPAKEQLATLLELVELPFDPAVIAGQRLAAFEARTDVNRRVKVLDGQIVGMKVPPADLPEIEIASADVLTELREGQAHNERVDSVMRHLAGAEAAATGLGNVDGSPVVGLIRQTVEALPELVDIEQFQKQLTDLEQTNAQVREGIRRREVVATRDALNAEVAAYTGRIEALDTFKSDSLAQAKMPLEGLGFDEDGVTYQGVPFSQASGAEQLRVSMAIAMAVNPKLRVIRITDGSLLDSTNMALIEEMAREGDFQVWVERVDESGSVGIVIEDGQVQA